MSGFKVTYPTGLEEVTIASDCETIEQFANTKFGSADFKEFGVKVALLTDKQVEDFQRGIQSGAAVAAEETTTPETLHQLADEMDAEAAAATDPKEKAKLEHIAEETHVQAEMVEKGAA